jgi:hypothetical protein
VEGVYKQVAHLYKCKPSPLATRPPASGLVYKTLLLCYICKHDARPGARTIFNSVRIEIVTHGNDGRIQDSDSYGNDPMPPRDRKH